MRVQPYLCFEGRCEEAIEYYRRVLGAEVPTMMRFRESPEACPEGMLPPGSEDRIMHAELRIGDSTILASDGSCTGQSGFKGISLTLTVASEAEAERVFAALGDGGAVAMPMDRTFFARRFGVVADKFGVSWMVILPA